MKNEIIKIQSKSVTIRQDQGDGQMSVCLSNGTDININQEEYERIIASIDNNPKQMIMVGRELINTAYLVGILDRQRVDSTKRKRRGEWQDKDGLWWDKNHYECPMCSSIIPKGKKCGVCGG